ncbi:MAG: hypothetical protein Q9168_003903 [Polycauliona sp. 1 TL-2023]
MKGLHLLTLVVLGAIPVIALPDPSNMLNERATKFVCKESGSTANCCDEILLDNGLGCVEQANKGFTCSSGRNPTCCKKLVDVHTAVSSALLLAMESTGFQASMVQILHNRKDEDVSDS